MDNLARKGAQTCPIREAQVQLKFSGEIVRCLACGKEQGAVLDFALPLLKELGEASIFSVYYSCRHDVQILPDHSLSMGLLNGNLSLSTWEVDDIGRKRDARQSRPKVGVEGLPFTNIDAQVSVSWDRVSVMEVVGDHAKLHKSLGQLHQGVHVVVDTPKKYGLIQYGNACFSKLPNGVNHWRAQFIWMVRVDDHPNGCMGFKSRDEFLADSGRRGHRGSRVNSKHRKHRADPFEESVQLGVAKAEGISPREDQLPCARLMGCSDSKGKLLICWIQPSARGVVSAKAVAAIDMTAFRDKKKRSVRMLLNEPGNRAHRRVCNRIGTVAACGDEFPRIREDL